MVNNIRVHYQLRKTGIDCSKLKEKLESTVQNGKKNESTVQNGKKDWSLQYKMVKKTGICSTKW